MEALKKLPLIPFLALEDGLNLLKKHLRDGVTIVGHADVDVDGNESMYIMKRYLDIKLRGLSATTVYTTNIGKEHGITEEFVEKVNNGTIRNAWDDSSFSSKTQKVDLVIITDSSSSELERIQKLSSDVLVLDHHSMPNIPLVGETAGGTYVIINPKAEVRHLSEESGERAFHDGFSAGLVVYEFLRHLDNELMVRLLLYQTAVVTLYSDSIPIILNNARTYVAHTLLASTIEPQLFTLIQNTNCYHKQITKNNLLFNINPLINKAIYYDKNNQALDILLNNPARIWELKGYREEMDSYVGALIGEEAVYKNHLVYLVKDEDGRDIYEVLSDKNKLTEKAFNRANELHISLENKKYRVIQNIKGMIASKLAAKYQRLALVGSIKDGVVYLSFRGDGSSNNYLSIAKAYVEFIDGFNFGGHKTSFGGSIPLEKFYGLLEFMEQQQEKIKQASGNGLNFGDNSYTFGNSFYGKTSTPALEDVSKRNQLSIYDLIRQLGDYNARNTSDMEKLLYMDLRDNSNHLKFKGPRGKSYQYDFMGFRAVAFKELDSRYAVSAYIEQGVDIQVVLNQTTVYLG